MKKLFTPNNIGFVLSILLGIFLSLSAIPMMLGSQGALDMFAGTNLTNWVTIIGIGKMLSIILFIIPKTQTIGILLLTALFGGAIMYHMSHANPAQQNFTAAVIFLCITWVLGWLRGGINFK